VYEPLKPYTGSHTVWLGPVPDYSMAPARAILMDHFEQAHLNLGVSGYKIDESDGYDVWLWPDVAVFPSGLTGEVMRQTYGLRLQRMILEAYREKNLRTYGLTRASNAGSSAYPFVLYNDYYSHRDFITALINSGFCGLLWTPEVRKSGSAEEWLRRMQSVCFSPMAMINAWADGTKPWSFPEVYESVQAVALLRMRLIPYLYSAFARYHFQGIPPFRAMVLEEGFTDVVDAKAKREALKDQFMVGDSLLVAPLFTGEKERSVVLPKGRWYDFYTGEYAGGGEVIKVAPGLEKIPLFVKDGGIIPLMPAVLNTRAMEGPIPLEVRHYGEAAGDFLLYDDDGETFDYDNGEFAWIRLKVGKNSEGEFEGFTEEKTTGYASPYSVERWRFISRVPGN
jgi:alpha-D-xyloside xylohydrolase